MYDVTSDIDAATRDVMDFFRDQVPFGIAVAVNDVAFEVRKHVIEVTFNRDFSVNNKSFARAAFGVLSKATKAAPEATVGTRLDREWTERQAVGGTRIARRKNIAIPLNPGEVRTGHGEVKAAKKPRNLKNSFFRQVNGKTVLFERKKKKIEAVYVLQHSAPIQRRFRFYEDAEYVSWWKFPVAISDGMDRAIRTSRFFPR